MSNTHRGWLAKPAPISKFSTTIRVVTGCLVLDNLSTHTKAALYDTVPPAEAHRLAQRLEFHHTPKHGSRLNAVEIELAALNKQCLARRIGEIARLGHETEAWTAARNPIASTVTWQFRASDAHIKLRHLYPTTANPSRR